jgi:hypothetical protein
VKKNIDLVRQVLLRRTKGAAFNPPPEGYEKYLAKTRAQIQSDFDSLTLKAFKERYKLYLW